MSRSRQWVHRRTHRYCVIASVALCAAIFPATAYATAPSNAHIRFHVPSTVSQLDPTTGASNMRGFLYWTQGASRNARASCCTNKITNLAGTVAKTVGKTTHNRFPITMAQGHCMSYKIASRDGRGRLVGSVISDPPVGCENANVDNDTSNAAGPGGSGTFSGSWSITNDPRDYAGAAHSSTTLGDSFTFTSDLADAWVTTTGPHHGSARIYIDGVYVKTVSTYSAKPHFRRIVWTKWWGQSLSGHTILIVNLATPGHPRIDVDGMAYLTDD